jgi:hypothetical protein
MPSAQHVIRLLTTKPTTCRLYNYTEKLYQLTFFKEIIHLENKPKDTDLTSDKSYPYQFSVGAYGRVSN